jgi:hypothetical protein
MLVLTGPALGQSRNLAPGFETLPKGLFALLYAAPRLTFFSRHRDRVEHIARTARVKG